jgi:hypothetical protein
MQLARQRSFESRYADFAIALPGMPIARLEQRPAHMNWYKERRPCHQFFIVEVACLYRRRPSADAA